MRRYNQRMFRVARSIVANDASAMDVVQDAHIKAFSKLNTFRNSSSFMAWLFTITRNEALMYLRKHKREVAMSNDDIGAIYSSRNSTVVDFQSHKLGYSENRLDEPESILENKQLQKMISLHVDELSDDFRIVFVLRAVEQLSVKETADVLSLNEETVKTRYFRAKRQIRNKIQLELDRIGLKVYEVGGKHCDLMVVNVMRYIDGR